MGWEDGTALSSNEMHVHTGGGRMRYGELKVATLKKPHGPVVVLNDDLARLPALASSGSTDADQLYRPSDGFRSLYDPLEFGALGIVGGYSDFVRLSDGFLMRVLRATTSKALTHTTCGDNWLRLQFWTDNACTVLFDRHGQADLRGGTCMINYHGPGVDKSEWLFGSGGVGTAVTIYCSPGFIARTFGPDLDVLPACIQSYMLSAAPELIFETVPLSPAMARVLTDIVQVPYRGALRRLFLNAKAMELVSLTVSSVNQCAHASAGDVQLGARDLDRLDRVRGLLESHISNPLTIEQLAREVGLNRRKLKSGFKRIYGMTIFEYRHNYRMEVAWNLLSSNRQSIARVAEAVGYEYASNFCSSFKRRFGLSPKSVQARRLRSV
jgi:AraC-like DNA-binding protein